MSHDRLGRGTYGVVVKVGNSAIKRFKHRSALIQEYMACVYLSGCEHTVDVYGCDIRERTTTMKLYNTNLRNWLLAGRTQEQKLIAFREILKALTYLTDLDIVHGDLKPDNILCNLDSNGNITKLVLGDLGFTAPERFPKAQRTAPAYREKVVEKDHKHDIHSLGVIGLEMFGNYKVRKQHTADELISLARQKIKTPSLIEPIVKCFNENRYNRPTSRWLLLHIFDIKPEYTPVPTIDSYNMSINEEQTEELKSYFINTGQMKLGIRRCRLAYEACIMAISNLGIIPKHYKTYAVATLVIFSSIFGSSGFTVELGAIEADISENRFINVIEVLMNDKDYVNMVFSSTFRR